jgi:hypothetical protein
MRDATHMHSVEAWARFVKAHPAQWKPAHSAFIDTQFAKHREFLERLKQQPGGKEKIRKLYAITNTRGYEGLLT